MTDGNNIHLEVETNGVPVFRTFENPIEKGDHIWQVSWNRSRSTCAQRVPNDAMSQSLRCDRRESGTSNARMKKTAGSFCATRNNSDGELDSNVKQE